MNNRGLFPEIINDFKVYKGNSATPTDPLIGIGNSLTLPTLDEITETLTGAGILGEVDANNPGHFSNIDWTIPFVCVCEELFTFNSSVREYLTIRATQQSTVKASGAMEYSGVKVIVGGKVKGYELGTLETGKRNESNVKFNVSYLKVELQYKNGDNKVAFELDKYNEKYVVDGKDMLAEIRAFS